MEQTISFSSIPGIIVRKLNKDLDKDLNELADLIRSAFFDLEKKSGFPEELSSFDVCSYVVRDSFDDGIVAINEIDGSYAGVNFLTKRDDVSPSIRGIGPIAVNPKFHGRGIGKLLMKCIKELGEHDGCNTFRLTVDTHNPVSFSIYSSLGYSIRNVLTTLQLPESKLVIDASLESEYSFKMIELDDLERIGKYMIEIIGFSKIREIRDLILSKKSGKETDDVNPVYLENSKGEIVAFSYGLNVISFSGANSEELWKHMFSIQVSKFRDTFKSDEEWIKKVNGAEHNYMFPSSYYPELFKWLLESKSKVVKNMFEMTLGKINEYPQKGKVYMPSVLY